MDRRHLETAWGLLAGALEKQQKLTEAEAELREALASSASAIAANHHSLTSTFRDLKQML